MWTTNNYVGVVYRTTVNVQEDYDQQHDEYDKQNNSNHCNGSYDDGRVKGRVDPCTQTEKHMYMYNNSSATHDRVT